MPNLSVSSDRVVSTIANNILHDKISRLAGFLDVHEFKWWKDQNPRASCYDTISSLMSYWNEANPKEANLSQLISAMKTIGCINVAEKLEEILKDQPAGVIPPNNTTPKIPALTNLTPQGATSFGHNWDDLDGSASSSQKYSKKQTAQPQGPMEQDLPQGKLFALIVNVVHDRPGAEKDETSLYETLDKCKFDVRIVKKEDRTEKKLIEEVKKFRDEVAGYNEKSPVGGIFVGLMSHGHKNIMFQTEDGGLISIEKIIGEFSFINSFGLRNVPKVFLVNMCRGEQFLLHPESMSQDDNEEQFNWEAYWKKLFENTIEEDDEKPEKATILSEEVGDGKWTWKNIYLGFSTTEGTLSYRYEPNFLLGDTGAWFVIDFCKVLRKKIENQYPTPIAEIFEETKQEVGKREGRLKNDPIHFRRQQIPIHFPVGFKNHFEFQLPKP